MTDAQPTALFTAARDVVPRRDNWTLSRPLWQDRSVPDSGTICPYCGDAALLGTERPEHAIPAALRAGMVVYTVCDECNTWAGEEIDQPFLADDFILLLRSEHDIRDPRGGPRRQRRVLSPLGHGFTADGIRITLDENWVPSMTGRIFEDEDSDEYRIVAGTHEELRKLTDRVTRRAAAKGLTASAGQPVEGSVQPQVRGQLQVRPWVWRREIAKIALACGSVAYPEEWRRSEDADLLRTWMRDAKALPYDHCPIERVADTELQHAFPAPAHGMFFMRGAVSTILTVVLFGDIAFKIPVDTAGRGVPQIAWYLDPNRPVDQGETTFGRLMMNAALRKLGEEPV